MGLYGDDALPGQGRDFRLHPIDWDGADGEAITISVEVDLRSSRPGVVAPIRIASSVKRKSP